MPSHPPLLALLLCALISLYATDGWAQKEPETPAQTPTAEESLLHEASSIAEKVGEIRGLALLHPIPKGVQDREQLRAMLLERFEEEVSEEEFEAETLVYKRLGLFDEDLDYRLLMLDLLTEQIAGFYDQEKKELYIMEGLPGPVQRPAMAHEIFHAIQDQHFDIDRLLKTYTSLENGDFALARLALIEGDASVLMIDYELYDKGVLPQNKARSIADIPPLAAALIEMDAEQLSAVEQLQPSGPGFDGDAIPSLTDSVLGRAPRLIRDVLLFPYIGGMRFVLRARAGRSWSAFNAIYEQAPVSTAQILHPERYFEGDFPLEIRFDLGEAMPEYEPIYESVLGELQTRSWLNTHFDEMEGQRSAEAIAAGWDGDRIRGYRGPDGEVLVVHMSTWRSVEEAQAFAMALEATARHRHRAQSAHNEGKYGESWCIRPGDEAKGERIYVERWGEIVLYIEGAPSKLDDAGRETDSALYMIRDAAWKSHRRLPFEQELRRREDEQAQPADASLN